MTTKDIEQKEEIFTRDFLLALSKWQNGWAENQEERRKIADELVRQCEKLAQKFKTVNHPCYRKRFIKSGELIPILIDNYFFEGVASWTKDIEYAKWFKGRVKPDVKHVMVFKHLPLPQEIVVNIMSLWEDEEFKKVAEIFKTEDREASRALFNFKDNQSEIVLRSTLKGNEIEDMVGISSSFDELCDMAGIPDDKREQLSIKYARDPNGLDIEIPIFGGARPTKEAIQKTLIAFRELMETSRKNNTYVDFSKTAIPHADDLKHKLD
ncbi:hypothetical protein SanaruYs_05620 [Chryseotalea sanaruensis]|uniref:Uncharacterized protein n=1 Tax=Chryseotalea sanaruensis TaxID=2482724 RepID=A0A401U636_9BACT|nr:hypothetical protein [Chryseotalea sanaruensis]GCC50347.1 hypothetical protein SanaruYs_05620 [Chryseotalea sanaruensis]